MTIDINELRRLAQEATPGPWMIDYVGVGFEVAAGESVIAQSQQIQGDMRHKTRKANAAFIAAANPAVMIELLDRLEAAEKDAAHQKALAESALRVAERWERKCGELRAKIAETERQEPVAWIMVAKSWDKQPVTVLCGKEHPEAKPVYLAQGAKGE